MNDLISRQAAIDAECEVCQIAPKKERGHNCTYYVHGCKEIECLRAVPSAQPKTQLSTEDATFGTTFDCISRQAAIDALGKAMPKMTTPDGCGQFDHEIQIADEAFIDAAQIIHDLPSAQPETAKRIIGMSRDGMTMWYQCDMCNEPVDEKDAFCSGCGRRFEDG